MPEQRCDTCGLDFSSITPPDAVVAFRSFPRRYRQLFAGIDDDDDVVVDEVVRRRPPSGGWSAIEYAAHVRDVLGLYERRIHATLAQEKPVFESVDPDSLAVEASYDTQSLDEVLEVLEADAASLAAAVEAIPDDGWARTGVRDGEEVDVLWLVRQAVHEGSHHLRDVERVLREVRSRG